MRIEELTPIEEACKDLLEGAEADIVNYTRMVREGLPKSLLNLRANREAIKRLQEAGLPWDAYGRGSWVRVKLGFFGGSGRGNRRLAAQVRAVRVALGCRLEFNGKDVCAGGRNRIEVSLRPVDYPEVTVSFQRPLAKGSKCRIVKHRSTYTSLVCEA